jgi:uroporphyrinogen-III decarboxylase
MTTDHGILVYAKMRELAMDAARYWRSNVYPLPFDHTFPLEGMRVRLVIERHVTPQDTKPIRIDEDDSIAD